MATTFTPEQLIAIEQQLSCPSGEMGMEVAKVMQTNNLSMTQKSIDLLDLATEDKVLEIGHGNAAHLTQILNQGKNITYFGLEISETMHEEAKRINKPNIDLNTVDFILYNGEKIPFAQASFNKVLTVNTVYFWDAPASFLNDIYRTLIPGGLCTIAFGHREYMKKLPYVNDRFQLYDEERMRWLISNSPFKLVSISHFDEVLPEAPSDHQNRTYAVVLLEK